MKKSIFTALAGYAAGLAIADTLKANARVATVAIRNANDGISTIGIADAALAQIGNVLARLAELAEQSANSTAVIDSMLSELKMNVEKANEKSEEVRDVFNSYVCKWSSCCSCSSRR